MGPSENLKRGTRYRSGTLRLEKLVLMWPYKNFTTSLLLDIYFFFAEKALEFSEQNFKHSNFI